MERPPSTPESGELVLSYVGRPAATEGRLFRAFLYADGRLIWDQEGPLEASAKAGPVSSSNASHPRASSCCCPSSSRPVCSTATSSSFRVWRLVYPGWAEISVRNGNRLVTVVWDVSWARADSRADSGAGKRSRAARCTTRGSGFLAAGERVGEPRDQGVRAISVQGLRAHGCPRTWTRSFSNSPRY